MSLPTLGLSLLSIFSLFFQTAHANTHRSLEDDLQSHRGSTMILLGKVTISPTPSMSSTGSPSSTIQPSHTLSPTMTEQPTSSTSPAPKSVPSSSDNVQQFIMNAINNYRKSQGLSPVATNDLNCNFAKVRAQEIATNFSHDGFNQRLQSNTLPYPNYALITENIAETPNYKDVVNMWIASPEHAKNMREDTPYVCVDSSGNYFAYEGWKPQ